jgi:hypothetical protein
MGIREHVVDEGAEYVAHAVDHQHQAQRPGSHRGRGSGADEFVGSERPSDRPGAGFIMDIVDSYMGRLGADRFLPNASSGERGCAAQ